MVVRTIVYIKEICGSCFQEGKNLTTKGKKVHKNRLWEEKEICTDRLDLRIPWNPIIQTHYHLTCSLKQERKGGKY